MLAIAVAPAGAAQRPPKIGEVDYFKEKGAQGPDTELEVFGKRIEALKIKASYGGEKAKATAREYTHVDDNRWGHPWIPKHDDGRRDLLNLMEESIVATGAVTLKLIAKNDAGHDQGGGADRVLGLPPGAADLPVHLHGRALARGGQVAKVSL